MNWKAQVEGDQQQEGPTLCISKQRLVNRQRRQTVAEDHQQTESWHKIMVMQRALGGLQV